MCAKELKKRASFGQVTIFSSTYSLKRALPFSHKNMIIYLDTQESFTFVGLAVRSAA